MSFSIVFSITPKNAHWGKQIEISKENRLNMLFKQKTTLFIEGGPRDVSLFIKFLINGSV